MAPGVSVGSMGRPRKWGCARILAAYGLPVAACAPVTFEDMKALAVERFDRAWWAAPQADNRNERLPQGDLCQAKGMSPAPKYETDGGPGIDAIFKVLEGSTTREQNRRVFFQAQVLFWMLCTTNGHAKNFGLFIRPGGRHQLTPLYDVLSACPVLGESPSRVSPHKAKLAMAVRTKNAHWTMKDILRRDWLELGTRHGVVTVDGRPATAVIDDLVARTPEALARCVRSCRPASRRTWRTASSKVSNALRRDWLHSLCAAMSSLAATAQPCRLRPPATAPERASLQVARRVVGHSSPA